MIPSSSFEGAPCFANAEKLYKRTPTFRNIHFSGGAGGRDAGKPLNRKTNKSREKTKDEGAGGSNATKN